LIPDTDSSAFRPGETNRLAVGAQGAQFIFLINDQIVANFSDPNLKTGQIGLGVNLPQAGQKANFEYSNFAVLAPTPAP
jgi:hypothetical protein